MKIYIVVERDNKGVYASAHKTKGDALTHIQTDAVYTTHEWGCILKDTRRIFERDDYYRYEYGDNFIEYTIIENDMEV